MKKCNIDFTVNGKNVKTEVNINDRLIDVLRNTLELTGTKEGCGAGECGACTVIMDGRAVNSCMIPAASLSGHSILTIEGLMKDEKLHPIQQAFVDHSAIQCGFCTPGLIMSVKALLQDNPHPNREEIKTAIAGNLCRCTGYEQVIEAVEDVARGEYGNDY